MTAPKPEQGHLWLHQLVGDWTIESKDCHSGTERVRKVGDLWVVGEADMRMPDGNTGTAILTLGFDPAKKRFMGTWVGSMMAHLWVYDGELDPSGKMLSLYAEGPAFDEKGNMDPGKTARYRDAIELQPDGSRIFTGSMQGPDGKWQTFVTSHYRKK
jgi:hypothetical protein